MDSPECQFRLTPHNLWNIVVYGVDIPQQLEALSERGYDTNHGRMYEEIASQPDAPILVLPPGDIAHDSMCAACTDMKKQENCLEKRTAHRDENVLVKSGIQPGTVVTLNAIRSRWHISPAGDGE